MRKNEFFKENWQFFFNIYIFLNISGFVVWQTLKTYKEGKLDFIEISFTVQNIVMLAFILLRRKHISINKNVFEQLIALFAFFSGLLFIGQQSTGGVLAGSISKYIILVSNILGIITLLNLGKSFGILIALRKIKTGGLYSVIRHPMYFTDILIRIGFVISHTGLFTITVLIISSSAYVYRAYLEEKFLKQDKEYGIYIKKVKYRFLPYIY